MDVFFGVAVLKAKGLKCSSANGKEWKSFFKADLEDFCRG